MASAVTRQQAMLAELLDSRDAELRVVMVAESLPLLAGEAAAKAVAEQSDGMADVVAAALDDFRASVQAADLSNVAVMDGMRELLRRVELTAELNTEDARDEGSAHLEALKASVGRQLKPVVAAIGEVADHVALGEEREAARTRALKASVTRQLQPLAIALEASIERSDSQLAGIHARLDALATPKVRAAKPAAPKAADEASPAKVPVKKARATARKPAQVEDSPVEIPDLVAYEAPPAPTAPPVLKRRPRSARPRPDA